MIRTTHTFGVYLLLIIYLSFDLYHLLYPPFPLHDKILHSSYFMLVFSEFIGVLKQTFKTP